MSNHDPTTPLLALPLLLAACATTPQNTPPETLYHARLDTAQGQALTFEQAVAGWRMPTSCWWGASHSPGHPSVAGRLLAGLDEMSQADGRALVLSMEQFSRADQPVLDAYLAGRIGESALIRDGHAWPNYQSDYRPLVEFAKAQHLPVIAANAPKPW